MFSCDHGRKTVTSEKDELGQVHKTHLGGLETHATTQPVNDSHLGQRNRALCRKGPDSYFETPNMGQDNDN